MLIKKKEISASLLGLINISLNFNAN